MTSLSAGGLYSSKNKSTEKKQRKYICLFLVKTRKWNIPKIVVGRAWRAYNAPKSCQECPGNCACHQLSDFGYLEKEQVREMLEGVLPSTQCNKDEKVIVIAIQHVFESVPWFMIPLWFYKLTEIHINSTLCLPQTYEIWCNQLRTSSLSC